MHGRAMIIELQGNAEDIIAFAFENTGYDRRIHSARHRNDDAGIFRALVETKAVHDLIYPIEI